MSYKFDSKDIDKLLLHEYINICKCTKPNIIEGIIDDIDTCTQNYTNKFNEVSLKYNLPKDKIIIINDIANRYRPNHKNTLLDIYQQYYKLVGGAKKPKTPTISTSPKKTTTIKTFPNYGERVTTIQTTLPTPSLSSLPGTLSGSGAISTGTTLGTSQLFSGQTGSQVRDLVRSVGLSVADSTTQALKEAVDNKLMDMEKQVTDQLSLLMAKFQDKIQTTVNDTVSKAVNTAIKSANETINETVNKGIDKININVSNLVEREVKDVIGLSLEDAVEKATVNVLEKVKTEQSTEESTDNGTFPPSPKNEGGELALGGTEEFYSNKSNSSLALGGTEQFDSKNKSKCSLALWGTEQGLEKVQGEQGTVKNIKMGGPYSDLLLNSDSHYQMGLNNSNQKICIEFFNKSKNYSKKIYT